MTDTVQESGTVERTHMSETAKKFVLGSSVVAGIVGLAIIVDLITGYPFSRKLLFDATMFIGVIVTLYMAYDTWKDLA